jgi:6,7-dimethyl-8-ribityllumazine synthase
MKTITLKANGKGLRIGLVQARFNEAITDKLLAGALRALNEAGVETDQTILVKVAGALEIPFALDALVSSDEIDAAIALGAVIKGDTYHFEIVCNECAAGITRVMLDNSVPIGNAVLTTYTEAQALERADQKGYEAAMAALELADFGDAMVEALHD